MPDNLFPQDGGRGPTARDGRDGRDDIDDIDDDRDDIDDDDDDDDDEPRRRRRDTGDRSRTSRSQSRALRRERMKTRQLESTIDQLKQSIGVEPSRNNGHGGNGNGRGSRNGGNADTVAPLDQDKLVKDITDSVRLEMEETYGARMIVTEAIAALKDAGIKTNPRRAVRLLDLESISIVGGRVDDDELLDAIDALREDSPELFRRSRASRAGAADEEIDGVDDPREDNRARPRYRRPARAGDAGSRETGGRGLTRRQSSLEQALRALGPGRSRER